MQMTNVLCMLNIKQNKSELDFRWLYSSGTRNGIDTNVMSYYITLYNKLYKQETYHYDKMNNIEQVLVSRIHEK